MSTQVFINNFNTTISATFGSGDTLLQLTSVAGLPVLGAGEFYKITLYRQVGVQESGWETVDVTSRTGNQLTVTRSTEGAAATQFLAGDRVSARVTASSISALETKANVAALALEVYDKADTSDVTASLALKANQSSTYTKTEVDTIASGKLSKVGGTITGPINESHGVDIASSSTIDLNAATGNTVDVTGSVVISAITLADGARRNVRFTGNPQLVQGSALLLPGQANISVAAGDIAEFVGYPSGLVICTKYTRVNGTSVISTAVPGIGGNTLTGNITLVNTSGGAVGVNPNGPGLYATLPAANTCVLGAVSYNIHNQGLYDYGVKDNAGTVLGWIKPGKSAAIGLQTNATAAGLWLTNELSKLGVTAQISVPSVVSNLGIFARVAIDSNRTLLLFGSLYGVVYDASTQTLGSSFLIRSMSNAVQFASALLSAANQVLVVSVDGSAISVNNLGISSVTISSLGSATTSAPNVVTSCEDVVAVGTGFAFGYSWNNPSVSSGNALHGISVTSGGSAVAISSSLAVTSANLPLYLFVTGSTLRVVYNSTNIVCAPYTLSGTTLTVGTSANGGGLFGSSAIMVFMNGNGNIVASTQTNGTFQLDCVIFKLTGTVEAASSAASMPLLTGSSLYRDHVEITNSKSLLLVIDNVGKLHWNVLVDTSGTASVGTEKQLDSPININVLGAIGLATGNIGRFTIGDVGDNINNRQILTYQISLDCSAATAVMTRVQVATNVGSAKGSDRAGRRRNGSKLTVSDTSYVIGSGQSYDGSYDLMNIKPLPSMCIRPLVSIAGSTSAESWILEDVGLLGTSIKRVEATV